MLIFDKDTPLNLNEFQNNGLGFLSDFITSPLITEELNSKGLFTGIYKLEFSYSKDGKNAEFLKELNFIKVPIDSTFQIFFIESIKITLKRIDVYAKHIFFITKNGFLEDSRPTNENATTALTNILEDTQFANTFSAYSDSGVESTAYYIRKNLIEAIITGDNSILKNWNCDLELDNFTIKLLSNRGSNTNFEIEYGKNLVGIEYSVDFSDVATRIYPQGANELLIAEKYIESELIDNYPFIFIKHIVFDDVEVNEEVSQEQAELILRSKVHELYYNGIDKPKINIKINWLDLSKTKEFEEYSHFEEVKLGDIINVRFQNMLITARIIKTVYDYNQQKFIAFELGSIKADLLKNQQQIIRQEIRSTVNIESVLKKAQANATSLITNALGGFVLKTENELFIMDTDDPNTATRVWRWNLNGLGYSSDGINGNYELAMTMDGQIVANFVNTGVLEGELIKSGTITANKLHISLKEEIEKVDEHETKIFDLETSVDGFSATAQKIEHLTDYIRNVGTVGNFLKLPDTPRSGGAINTLRIRGFELRELYPGMAYPSEYTYPGVLSFYTLIFDTVPTFDNNPHYIYINSPVPLQKLGSTYDELIIEANKVKVIQRIGYDFDNEKWSVLSTPITHELNDVLLPTFDGDTFVSVKYFDNLVYDAEYLIKNDLTSNFATQLESSSQFKISQDEIEAKVNKDGIISSINLSPEEIKIDSNKITLTAKDVLNLLAGKELNLKSQKMSIVSDNLLIKDDGQATFKINGEEIFNDKGVITSLTFPCYGFYGGYDWLGYAPDTVRAGYQYYTADLIIKADIPANFVIKKAYITLTHTPIRWADNDQHMTEYWGYSRNIRVYRMTTNAAPKYFMMYASVYYIEKSSLSGSEITNAFGSSGFTATNTNTTNYETVNSVDIGNVLTNGSNTLVLRSADPVQQNNTWCIQRTGMAKAVLNVIGYMKI